MRPWITKTLYLGVLLFVIIQFFPVQRTNPPIDPTQTIHAYLNMNPSVSSALARGCNDCHSNLTVWPWYSKVAPMSWLVVSDVRRGRKALNFSEWKALSPEKQREIMPEICKEVDDREMPTEEYVIMHPKAKPTRPEIKA